MLTGVTIKEVKSLLAVSPRFPAQRSSAQGESAPKARQKCVADGKQVNIPAPSFECAAGTDHGRLSGGWKSWSLHWRRRLGKSGRAIQGCGASELEFAKQSEGVPRKASKLKSYETVPQTDTGGQDEYSKALERTREKELGKLDP